MAATFTQKPDQPISTTVTILNGASLSGAVNIKGFTLTSVIMPATWTAANLTIQVSYDGTNYFNLYQADGTEYTLTAAASRAIVLPPADFATVSYIKLRSGTSGAPTNQGADRIITLIAANV